MELVRRAEYGAKTSIAHSLTFKTHMELSDNDNMYSQGFRSIIVILNILSQTACRTVALTFYQTGKKL